jgi:hypothetical protein
MVLFGLAAADKTNSRHKVSDIMRHRLRRPKTGRQVVCGGKGLPYLQRRWPVLYKTPPSADDHKILKRRDRGGSHMCQSVPKRILKKEQSSGAVLACPA